MPAPTPPSPAPEPDAVRVTLDGDDPRSVAVLTTLRAALDEAALVVRDARDDPATAAWLDGLACCGPRTPVVECGGRVVPGADPAEALALVRRVAPQLVR